MNIAVKTEDRTLSNILRLAKQTKHIAVMENESVFGILVTDILKISK